MLLVYVHLADGFEEVEALTTVDLFRRAQIGVQTVSITGKKEVTGAHNVTVEADILFEETDYEQCEMIVLPGGMPGAEHLGNHEGLTSHIRCFAKNDKYIAAICRGLWSLVRWECWMEKSRPFIRAWRTSLAVRTIKTKR